MPPRPTTHPCLGGKSFLEGIRDTSGCPFVCEECVASFSRKGLCNHSPKHARDRARSSTTSSSTAPRDDAGDACARPTRPDTQSRHHQQPPQIQRGPRPSRGRRSSACHPQGTPEVDSTRRAAGEGGSQELYQPTRHPLRRLGVLRPGWGANSKRHPRQTAITNRSPNPRSHPRQAVFAKNRLSSRG